MSEEKPLNIPEYLLLRSAEARAKALGISVEQALADIKGVPLSEVSTEEPVVEEEVVEEPVVEEEEEEEAEEAEEGEGGGEGEEEEGQEAPYNWLTPDHPPLAAFTGILYYIIL